MKTLPLWLCLAGLLAAPHVPGALGAAGLPSIDLPPTAKTLLYLRKDHPRLLVSKGDLARMKRRVAANPQLKDWHKKLQDEGDKTVREEVARYEIPDGLRLLSVSRRVLRRTYTLALLYRLQGDRRYLDRAWQELETAANFADWNPRHFLDTAEMTHAFAIAYDWLYEAWTPEQRATLRRAMVDKGLQPALECYRGSSPHRWWTRSQHNWNQVCNGGIGMGALALADELPDIAGECLIEALRSLPLAMQHFAPDGAWNEGPGYWNYATSYNAVFLAALESALGRDFGLSSMPGFAETGLFPIYLTGPLGRTFNYADGGDATIRAPQMFWFARKFNRPTYAWYGCQVGQPAPLDLVWFDQRGQRYQPKSLPLDRYFRDAEVATLRSDWQDREAIFVGLKAGDNKANHSNLDLGTFVLDALGVRWAVDLGADNYNLPGYFGKERWSYYRMRAESHNTLVINPGNAPDQDPTAATRIIQWSSKPKQAFAIADLTPAYARQARSVQRGLALIDRREVLVQDEIEALQPAEIWWFLHTAAEVTLNEEGRQATLSQGTVRLRAQLLAPTDARFTVMNAKPLPSSPHPAKQASNEGIRKLAVHLSEIGKVQLAVRLVPLREGESLTAGSQEITPLAKW